ncbi:MAG: hypothetical protein WCK05_10705 [Planctomycetota bacterium]
MISISDPGTPKPRIRTDGLCRAILRFRFHDAEPAGNFSMPPTIKLMTSGEATEIWEAVQQHRGQIDTIVVHCEAGMGRSPPVAAALCHALGRDDTRFFQEYQPNMHSYGLILQAADMDAGR